jgi:hypothetical protein
LHCYQKRRVKSTLIFFGDATTVEPARNRALSCKPVSVIVRTLRQPNQSADRSRGPAPKEFAHL